MFLESFNKRLYNKRKISKMYFLFLCFFLCFLNNRVKLCDICLIHMGDMRCSEERFYHVVCNCFTDSLKRMPLNLAILIFISMDFQSDILRQWSSYLWNMDPKSIWMRWMYLRDGRML